MVVAELGKGGLRRVYKKQEHVSCDTQIRPCLRLVIPFFPFWVMSPSGKLSHTSNSCDDLPHRNASSKPSRKSTWDIVYARSDSSVSLEPREFVESA
jgi:hypothetical protein